MPGSYPAAEARVPVLLVEDETLIAEYMEAVLEGTRFEVVGSAESGEQALDIAERTRPQLALVDINLKGGMDGMEVAVYLRERFAAQFVFATGSHDPDTRARAEALSPLGFLAKPFTPKHLLRLLESIWPQAAP